MAKNIDQLNIEIKASAEQATKSVRELKKSVTELKGAFEGTYQKGEKTARGVDKLSVAINNLDATKLDKLTRSLNSFNGIVAKVEGLNKIADSAKQISSAINTLSKSSDKLSQLATNLNSLDTSGLDKFQSEMTQLATTSEVFGKMNDNMKSFSKSITSLVRTSDKLPKLFETINNLDMDKFSQQMSKLSVEFTKFAQALEPINAKLSTFATVMNRMPTQINKMVTSVNRLGNAQRKASSSNGGSGIFGFMVGAPMKSMLGLLAIDRLAKGLMYCVEQSASLAENINLFSVALNVNAQEGAEFIDMLGETMGINTNIASKYMGQFYQISSALGLADKNAMSLSKNFTKLTYDLASFFNIDYETAFEKLRAGLVLISLVIG